MNGVTTSPMRSLAAPQEPFVPQPQNDLVEENQRLRTTLEEMRTRLAELERLADCDTLTPLPNRRAFMREVERVVGQVERYNTPAALLYVDVDQLKAINDGHGHAGGDAALIHVARLLADLVRQTDFVARIGGDEFGLVLDHLDAHAAADTAARIAQHIADTPAPFGDGTIDVSVSIGMTTVERGDTVEGSITRADRNMYQVKALIGS